MNKNSLRNLLLALTILASIFAWAPSSQAQCSLDLSSPNNTATVNILAPWYYPPNDTNAADNPSYLQTTVLVGNAVISNGTYLAWCIDFDDIIQPSGFYPNVQLFSTCDPNIDVNLPINYPSSVYTTAENWHALNYLLNHKNGNYFMNLQEAIWNIVGGPADTENSPLPYPQYDTAAINAILADVQANAAAWQPKPGDVLAAVVAIQADPHAQLTIIEVPTTKTPCTITWVTTPTNMDLGCNPASIPDCTGQVDTNFVYATTDCNTTITYTCSKQDSQVNCKYVRTLTYTAADDQGHSITTTQTITWTIDTTGPVLTAVPAGTNYGCNPTTLPSDADVKSQVSTIDTCSTPTVSVVHVDGGSPCAMTRTFTITAIDSCSNKVSTNVVYCWKVDTNAPIIISLPGSTNYGCNPLSTVLPTDISIKGLVSASDNCGSLSIYVSHVDGGTPCSMNRTFTVVVIDGCSNTTTTNVTYLWKVDTTAPTIMNVPASTNYGCNPSSSALPTDASIKAIVGAIDNCGGATINVTHVDGGSPCAMIRTFCIVATDSCGNSSTNKVAYTWKVDTTAPTIINVPGTTNYGCNPASSALPTDASITAIVGATDNCGGATINVTHTDGGSPCAMTRTFKIVATDGCGNSSTNSVTYTWKVDLTGPILTCVPDYYITNGVTTVTCYNQDGWRGACNNNPCTIVSNCFGKIYTNGYLECGVRGTGGHSVKCSDFRYIKNLLPCSGTPACLSTDYSNPSSCSGGSFAGHLVCLQLNVDCGDNSDKTGFAGCFGNLTLNDPTCPLNGKSFRQIANICNTAIGGGSSAGCTLTQLCNLASNLNNCFSNNLPSDWCKSHVTNIVTTNVPPSVSGTPTAVDSCGGAVTLTYSDVVTSGGCGGAYTITRTWKAVDTCGNTNTCVQHIYIGNSSASVCGYVFKDCNGDGRLSPSIDVGLSNIVVTLKNGSGVVVATNTTDATGGYCFVNLAAGTYTVCVATPASHTQTAGCHTSHWNDDDGNDCWNDNDGYQHWKGSDGVDCWNANDGCKHYKNSSGQDCWKDRYGYTHTQNCNYTSCNVPKNNCETFTIAGCEAKTSVNFSYQGVSATCLVNVTGPSKGVCNKTYTYTCTVTNTGSACFTACNVNVCGNSYPCPSLKPGEGCSFQFNYCYKSTDYGTYNCKATATCNYNGGNNCYGSDNCNTSVSRY